VKALLVNFLPRREDIILVSRDIRGSIRDLKSSRKLDIILLTSGAVKGYR